LGCLVERGFDAHLSVIGGPSGPHGASTLADLHEAVEREGLRDRVSFVEPQPHHLLSTWYRASDVVLVPSRSESFGLVALEAATCGIPVVASKVGGLTTLVHSGTTGELIETADPARYASAIAGIVSDPATHASYAAASVALAAPYTWRAAATAFAASLEHHVAHACAAR
jgi:D-inositol-3-phosphate glycosyltransferase